MNITNGNRNVIDRVWKTTVLTNDLRRIYDRLRKRSYRKIGQWYTTDSFDLIYDGTSHAAYVQGVRDALNAITDE